MTVITHPHCLNHCPDSSGAAVGFALRLLREKRAAAAVEFALVLPVLVLLAVGMVDYGALTFESMEVYASAHAGSDYAIKNGWNATAIQSAVAAATPLAVAADPAPVNSQYCVSGGVLISPPGPTCPTGSSPGTYVIVHASTTFTPVVAWSAFVLPSTLTAQSVVRIK
jgi:Flp pilus assembly protein TadG